MSKVQIKDKVDEEVIKAVTAYVHKNYKQYEDKHLYIQESDNCFYVSDNKDASPLILGKGIIA
jgi:hypothetical protein